MIGVIIVTYNASAFLEKCLTDLKNDKLFVIVVDNCSNDSTVDLIRSRFDWLYLIQSERNLGFGRANNLGIKKAIEQQCDSILLLNQDAYFKAKDALELYDLLQKNKGYGVLAPLHLRGDQKDFDYYFSGYITPKQCKLLFDLLFGGDLQTIYPVPFVNAAIWMISVEVVKKVGVFDPMFDHYGEDVDWINRLHFFRYKVGVCPQIAGIHDRPQERFSTRRTSLIKAVSKAYVGELVKLKNINKPFSSQFMTVHVNLIKTIVMNTLKLNRKSLVYLIVLVRLLYNFRRIYNNREICKIKKDYRFL